MFLSYLIEEICTKEENNKAGCNFNFGHQSEKRVSSKTFSLFSAILRYNGHIYCKTVPHWRRLINTKTKLNQGVSLELVL